MKRFEKAKIENQRLLRRGGGIDERLRDNRAVANTARHWIEIINSEVLGMISQFGLDHQEFCATTPNPQTPHEIQKYEHRAKLATSGGWFLLALKLFFWLLFSPAYFNFVPLIASAVGATLSLAISLAVKDPLALWIAKSDFTPTEKEDRINRLLTIFLILVIVGLALIFLIRAGAGVAGEDDLYKVFSAIGFLDLALLLLAGVMFAKKFLFGWSGRHLDQYRTLLEFRRGFREHLAEAEQNILCLIRRNQPPPTTAIQFMILVATVLAAGFACDAQPAPQFQETPHLVFNSARPSESPQSRPRGEIDIHISSSRDSSNLVEVAESLAGAISRWAVDDDIQKWEIRVFEGDAWAAKSIGSSNWPGYANSPCQRRPINKEGGIFGPISDTLVKESVRKCEEWRSKQMFVFRTTLATTIRSAAKAKPTRVVGCSSVYDGLARLALLPEGSGGALLTDGVETCGIPRRLSAPRRGVRIIVILAPSNKDWNSGTSPAIRFEQRKQQLLKNAPWIYAVLPEFKIADFNIQTATEVPTQPAIRR